jgi:phosphate transport system substrate-binding protein
MLARIVLSKNSSTNPMPPQRTMGQYSMLRHHLTSTTQFSSTWLRFPSTWLSAILAIIGLAGGFCVSETSLSAQESAPSYAPDKPIEGSIEIVGSTLMQPIAALWMEEFSKIHPELKSTIDCQGSEDSFKKVTNPTAVVGLLSREVTSEELASLNTDAKNRVVAISVGYDVISIIVNPKNPLKALAWDAKIGSPLSIAGDKSITKWGDLGVEGELADKPLNFIVIGKNHGLRTVSESVLAIQGKPDVKLIEKESQLEILEAVAADPAAIAVVSSTRVTNDSVRPLPIALDASRLIASNNPQAVDLGYPLLRKLTVVARLDESGKLAPQIEEFIRFVLSNQGQDSLVKDGFVPLDRSDIYAQQELLGWEVLK